MRKAILVGAALAALAVPASAGAKTVWLCKPGAKADPCVGSLTASVVDANGNVTGTRKASNAKKPAFDCFYVYPTISDDNSPISNLQPGPEEISVAKFQAQRFSQVCRVFAPMYRSATLTALFGRVPPPTAAQRKLGDRDLVAAWHEYLKKYNHGRGVVLVGHSQGASRLRTLIQSDFDNRPATRKRLISAVLLGGNILVKSGSDRGGDFKNIPACRSTSQTGCVIAYSMFNEPPPASSIFGRTKTPGMEVLCTNPAALGGGSGRLDGAARSGYPAGTIGVGVQIFEGPLPKVSTPWLVPAGTYSAHCESSGGATWLQVTPGAGARTFTASPDPTWGWHLGDVNLAADTLVADLKSQARAYLKRH